MIGKRTFWKIVRFVINWCDLSRTSQKGRRRPCGKSAPVRWWSDASNRDAYSPAWVNTKSVILSSLRTFRICECESVEENYRILYEPNSIQIFHEGWAIFRPLQLSVSKQMAMLCELQQRRYWASFKSLWPVIRTRKRVVYSTITGLRQRWRNWRMPMTRFNY